MRPIALVLAAVMAVAGAYALIFWRNAPDVRQQLEDEQAARTPEVRQFDDHRRDPSDLYPTEPFAGANPAPSSPSPERTTEPTLSASPDTNVEPSEADLSASSPDLEGVPTAQAGDAEAQEPAQPEVDKQLNYAALERAANQIGADIQRQMRQGEILRRGRSVGAELLHHSGYAVNGSGEHVTPAGTFVVDVKGPDLIVMTGTSATFSNQLEITIIGPRDVDRRLRRVR